MTGALIILAVTVLTGLILYILDKRKYPGEAESTSDLVTQTSDLPEPSDSESGSCCGLHLVCEKELKAIAEDRILYYDDEELDRFVGRLPEEYTGEEEDEFRDIMLTLLPQDVPGWARSLDRRGIRPPQAIRDELIMMMAE